MKTKVEEAEKKVIVFRGRKYYYRHKFRLTYEGRCGAERYAKKLAMAAKTWTLVRRVPEVGYCIYVTKTMKRGGRI